MEKFVNFLIKTKEAFNTGKNRVNKIHIVIGNESSDLDSTISCLLLAYLLDNHKKLLNLNEETVIVPVINVPNQLFDLRTETCYVLEQGSVTKDLLIFRDEINFEDLIERLTVTTSLVDHHILPQQNESLQDTVVQIFDHRPADPNTIWPKECSVVILTVGSCATLITNEILRVDEELLTNELAFLLYQTIVYDTIALAPEHGKAQDLDISIAKKLENKFNWCSERKILFDILWGAHNDVSNIPPAQLLYKDLKVEEGIPVPGLPMLVETYLTEVGVYEAINELADKYKSSVVVLVGLNANKTVERDIGIFWKDCGLDDKNKLIEILYNSEELKGYDFGFSEGVSPFHNIICLHQTDTTLSRKQIIPLLKLCFKQI